MALDQQDPALANLLCEQVAELYLDSGMEVQLRLLDGADLGTVAVECRDDDREDLRDADADVRRPHGHARDVAHKFNLAVNMSIRDRARQVVDRCRRRVPQQVAGRLRCPRLRFQNPGHQRRIARELDDGAHL